jgi:hypothetical protein
MGANRITGMADGIAATDAATVGQIVSADFFLLKASNLSDVANATTARGNLTAAKSGANSDITSITGLTTPLAVSQGGIGAATLTANNVLLGNGTSAPQVVAPSTSGNVLTSNGTTWVSSTPAATVTSAVAGNGVAVSGATGAVTFSAACPTAGSVGSYAFVIVVSDPNENYTVTFGTNYAAGTGRGEVRAGSINENSGNIGGTTGNILSGTWKWLGNTTVVSVFNTYGGQTSAIACRVS